MKRRPRTISALPAVSRYSSVNHRFRSLSEVLGTPIDYRNGVVRLVADQPEGFVGVSGEYLKAVELVLEDLGQGEKLFWGGPELLAVVQGQRSRRTQTIEEDVARQVATAAGRLQARYQHLSPDERQAAMLAAVTPRAPFYEDYIFQVECLASGSDGWLGVGIDVGWELDNGEMVPHANTSPAMFQCTVCGLALVGDEIEAGLGDTELPDDFPSERVLRASVVRRHSGPEYGGCPRVSATLMGMPPLAPINCPVSIWWIQISGATEDVGCRNGRLPYSFGYGLCR